MDHPLHLFVYIRILFQTINFIDKTEDFSGIRTRIVGVEGENANHLTTTAQSWRIFEAFCFAIWKSEM